MATRIQLRRGTSEQWALGNPILAEGEVGVETDTHRIKFGDGINAWTGLPYSTMTPTDVAAAIAAEPTVVTFVFDGQGNDVEAGEVARLVMPYSATITGWRVIGSSAGTFSATLRRATFAAFPTMTTISGSDPPALAGTQKAEDTALTGWTTALAMGDVVELLVTEATVPWVSVQIVMTRS